MQSFGKRSSVKSDIHNLITINKTKLMENSNENTNQATISKKEVITRLVNAVTTTNAPQGKCVWIDDNGPECVVTDVVTCTYTIGGSWLQGQTC